MDVICQKARKCPYTQCDHKNIHSDETFFDDDHDDCAVISCVTARHKWNIDVYCIPVKYIKGN